MSEPVTPEQQRALVEGGMVARAPILCELCGKPMSPGEMVMCNDGYLRIYGEFVLGTVDDLHEDNWPSVHTECAALDDAGGFADEDR